MTDDAVEDDRLRLIFTCCHPALPPDAQVAMTLREMCGLTTEEIARAFLVPPPTIAQRIVRAKSKIRTDRIPYAVPDRSELDPRLDAVLRVVYLVFAEGYDATAGDSLTRTDLCAEAIRLGRLLARAVARRARGAGTAGPDAAPRVAPSHTHRPGRRAGPARRSGSIALGSAMIEEGLSLAQAAMTAAPGRFVRDPGRDRSGARAGANRGRHRLGSDRGALRPAPAGRSITGGGPQSGRRDRDARWPGSRSRAYRRADRARRPGPAPSRPRRPRGSASTLGRTSEAANAYTRAIGLVKQDTERRYLERRLAEVTDDA